MRMRVTTTVLILLLGACGGEQAESETVEAAASSQPAAAASAASAPPASPAGQPAAAGAALIVRDAGGKELLNFREEDRETEISFFENGKKRTIWGGERTTGKRKYEFAEGGVLFEVKPDSDSKGFKLRTPDGKLRWKVKVTDDKIKISDNEGNDNPFELKRREGDRVKVVAPGDKELGNVRFDRAAAKTEIETPAGTTKFSVAAPKPSAAWGVLLLDSIPEKERYILAAEILSRGQ
jgi:hypothetical protein